VRNKVDSLRQRSSGRAKIVIMGDFNCTPDDQEMKILTIPNNLTDNMINLSERISKSGVGTYRYMGTWEMIDQVLVSELFLSTVKGLYTNEKLLSIFKPDFLLKKDSKYPGYSPLSTYRGYKYQGGYSDHLPVLLDLNIKLSDQQE
jgi:endonuclease/exonuclease/phosphatase family metal-dependent hydrolase